MSDAGATAGGRIRPATASDLPGLCAIAAADAFGTWSEAAFVHELEIAWSHVEVVDRPGEGIVGFLVYWHTADELQLLNIATHPAHMRRGIGRELMRHLCSRARELQAATITLEVRQSNAAARALYATCGFATVGRRPGYFQKAAEDAILMTWSREHDDGA